MSEELGPCPHCSSESLEVYRFMQVAKTNQQYVWCHGCDAHGPIGNGAGKAVELWNWRRGSEAEADRLRTAIREAVRVETTLAASEAVTLARVLSILRAALVATQPGGGS